MAVGESAHERVALRRNIACLCAFAQSVEDRICTACMVGATCSFLFVTAWRDKALHVEQFKANRTNGWQVRRRPRGHANWMMSPKDIRSRTSKRKGEEPRRGCVRGLCHQNETCEEYRKEEGFPSIPSLRLVGAGRPFLGRSWDTASHPLLWPKSN